MDELKDNLTRVILSDPAILTPIVEAVAEALVSKLLSPDRIDSIVDGLSKSETLVSSMVNSLEPSVKQELYESLQMDSEDMGYAITCLEGKYSKLQESHQALLSKADDLEQYSRRNCLVIHGLVEADDNRESKESRVVATLNGVIPKLSIAIDRAHRLGKPNKSPSNLENRRPRPLIVKFVRYAHLANIFRQKCLLGTDMATTESLTPTRLALLKAA